MKNKHMICTSYIKMWILLLHQSSSSIGPIPGINIGNVRFCKLFLYVAILCFFWSKFQFYVATTLCLKSS